MPNNYTQLQQSLTFDELMRLLDEQFQTFPDKRIGNAVSYQLPDVLKAAFAMFSLKAPSLLDFKTQTTAEEKNLHNIYRIQGEIPSDNQMRGILDPLSPQLLRPLFHSLFERLSQAGLIRQYQYRNKAVIVSADGVEHLSSTKVHCSSCTTRKHRNGKISYHHSAIAAVIVHPDQKEVIPLDFEPVLNQDGAQKNDCERNAAKRLCQALHERYSDLKIILVEDALYANAPHIRQITSYGWHYILNVKPDSHKSLLKQFAGRQTRGQVKELRRSDERGVEHYYAWTNDLCLCESATDVTVNLLLYEQTTAYGQVKRWAWITKPATDDTHGGKGDASRTQPLEDRERDVQHIEESGLTFRAQLRTWQAKLGNGTGTVDVSSLHYRSDSTTVLPLVWHVASRPAHEDKALGIDTKPFQHPCFQIHGGSLSASGFSLSPST